LKKSFILFTFYTFWMATIGLKAPTSAYFLP